MMRGTRYAKHTAASTQIVNTLSEDKNAKYSAQPKPHSQILTLGFLSFSAGWVEERKETPYVTFKDKAFGDLLMNSQSISFLSVLIKDWKRCNEPAVSWD